MSDLPMIVKVKPLVWKWSGQVDGWRADCELTRDVFITYQSLEKWAACSQVFRFTYHQTAEDAKAHLDQMRASRIIATIEAVPVSEVMTLAALAAERDRLETAHRQMQQTLDRLSEENARLRDALIWCSGSADFNEGGIAADGWQKLCAPLLKGSSHD